MLQFLGYQMEGLNLSDFLNDDGLIPVDDCDDLLQWVNGLLDGDSDAGLASSSALQDADCAADPKPSTSSIPDMLKIHVGECTIDDDDFHMIGCNDDAEDKNIPAQVTNKNDLSLIDSEEDFGDDNDATIAWVEETKQGTKETKVAAKRRRDRMRRKRNRVRSVMDKRMVRLGQKSWAEVEEENRKREVLSKLQDKRAAWKKQMREDLKKKQEEEKKRMMREVEKKDKRVVKWR